MPVALRFVTSIAVATAMCQHGLQKRSLSGSGAAAAFCMGVLHMTCGWTFGCVLICFFISSSKLTKFHQEQKAKLDAHIKPGGQRNALQVLCNSATGAAAAVVASAAATVLHGRWTALVPVVQLAAWSAFLGHYSCCCADTWASELGMLSSSRPRLITTPQCKVPAGVNGGVTLLGFAASAAGGACMGISLALLGWSTGEVQHLAPIISMGLQRRGLLLSGLPSALPGFPAASSMFKPFWVSTVFWVVLSLICGLSGSVVDSLLGATLQYSGYCSDSGKVVAQPGPDVKHISGRPWLSNDAVNAVSACLAGLMATALACRLVL